MHVLVFDRVLHVAPIKLERFLQQSIGLLHVLLCRVSIFVDFQKLGLLRKLFCDRLLNVISLLDVNARLELI